MYTDHLDERIEWLEGRVADLEAVANEAIECLTDHWGQTANMPAVFEALYHKLRAAIALATST